MFIRILPTTLFQIFFENLLYFQVIFKNVKIADDTFLGNSECEWVKVILTFFSSIFSHVFLNVGTFFLYAANTFHCAEYFLGPEYWDHVPLIPIWPRCLIKHMKIQEYVVLSNPRKNPEMLLTQHL